MKILVTNDDGIFSPGLVALAEVASRFGQVRIVAPDVEQSAMGHAITIQRPLAYLRTALDGFEAYRVNGTPADCVALGLYHWQGADLVLSGINLGSNLGHEIWHSGTVAAAKEAVLLGSNGIAFSLVMRNDPPDFGVVKGYVEEVVRQLLSLPRPVLVNVNIPQSPRGIVWARQSIRAYSGKVVESHDPMGRRLYWFAEIPLTNPEQGTDRWAVAEGDVALTPLRLDLTDERALWEIHQTTEAVDEKQAR